MKTIGIYTGQFQPPHKGHLEAYKKLRKVAGPDTFVVTTDYDPTLEAALHFGDKEQVLVRHGVDASHIRKVRDLNNPSEVLDNFDPETTIVIYALPMKEAQRRLTAAPDYYKLVSAGGQKFPFGKAAYILPINDDLVYKNRTYTSKNIREALGSHRFTNKDKQNWFKHFFGWFDLGLFELLKNKYENAHSAADGVEQEINIKEELAKEICNILNELMTTSTSTLSIASGPGSQNNSAPSTTNQDNSNQPIIPTLADLQKQKQAMQTKLDGDENELQLRKKNVTNFRKTLPLKSKEVSGTSSKISSLKPSLSNPETRRQAQAQKNSLIKNRELGTKKLDTMKQSDAWEKDRQESLRNDDIPDDKDALDQINKNISSGNYNG